MNDALDISPEVALGAASIRTEAEVRVLKVRGSYDAPGFEACVKAEEAEMAQAQAREQRIGEAGQRAFLGTIDTAGLLNLAVNKVHCMWQNENLTEEESDAKLLAFCLELTGDPVKAQFLASAAKWS